MTVVLQKVPQKGKPPIRESGGKGEKVVPSSRGIARFGV